MPIPVECTACATKLKAPDKAAGRKTKCPKCGTAIVVPSLTKEPPSSTPSRAEEWMQPPVVVQRPRPPAPSRIEPDDEDLDYEPRSRRRSSVAAAAATVIINPPSRVSHSLGIAALVVGVLSFFVCWIPFLGIALSALGLLLGGSGLVLAIVRKGSGIGFSIAGVSLSVLSLGICIVWTVMVAGAVKAVDKALTETARTNQNVVTDLDRDKTKPVPVTPPEKEKSPLPPTKNEKDWIDVKKGPVRQGDLQIKVAEVTIGQVPLKAIGGNSTSKDKLLMITLELLNTNQSKKVDYRSWSGADFTIDRDFATLKDNFDNSYKRITFGLGSHPIGAVERSASIYPNKLVTDILVFELPLDTVEYLRLELPAKNFSGTGMLRLQIPKDMIQR